MICGGPKRTPKRLPLRLPEVTACVWTFRSLRPVAFLTSSTILPQISQPKPVGRALSSRYENGIDASR